MKLYEGNGKSVGMVNGWYQKVQRFSSNEFWRNIGCIVSYPIFGIGGLGLWEKEQAQNIIGKNSKRSLIRMKVDLYEVYLSYFIYCLLFYIMTIQKPFFFTRFVAYLTPGEIISGSIGQKNSSRNRKSINMNGVGKGC